MGRLVGTFPEEVNNIPAYFVRIEKIFSINHIDENIQANLLMMNLPEKAKSRLDAVSAEGLKDYTEVKNHLLKEYKMNAIKLRNDFLALRKMKD